MAKLLWVRSTLPVNPDGSSRVALWDQDRDHPNGEVFVAGPKPVQVAATGRVNGALREGVLEEVRGPEDTADAPAKGK